MSEDKEKNNNILGEKLNQNIQEKASSVLYATKNSPSVEKPNLNISKDTNPQASKDLGKNVGNISSTIEDLINKAKEAENLGNVSVASNRAISDVSNQKKKLEDEEFKLLSLKYHESREGEPNLDELSRMELQKQGARQTLSDLNSVMEYVSSKQNEKDEDGLPKYCQKTVDMIKKETASIESFANKQLSSVTVINPCIMGAALKAQLPEREKDKEAKDKDKEENDATQGLDSLSSEKVRDDDNILTWAREETIEKTGEENIFDLENIQNISTKGLENVADQDVKIDVLDEIQNKFNSVKVTEKEVNESEINLDSMLDLASKFKDISKESTVPNEDFVIGPEILLEESNVLDEGLIVEPEALSKESSVLGDMFAKSKDDKRAVIIQIKHLRNGVNPNLEAENLNNNMQNNNFQMRQKESEGRSRV